MILNDLDHPLRILLLHAYVGLLWSQPTWHGANLNDTVIVSSTKIKLCNTASASLYCRLFDTIRLTEV